MYKMNKRLSLLIASIFSFGILLANISVTAMADTNQITITSPSVTLSTGKVNMEATGTNTYTLDLSNSGYYNANLDSVSGTTSENCTMAISGYKGVYLNLVKGDNTLSSSQIGYTNGISMSKIRSLANNASQITETVALTTSGAVELDLKVIVILPVAPVTHTSGGGGGGGGSVTPVVAPVTPVVPVVAPVAPVTPAAPVAVIPPAKTPASPVVTPGTKKPAGKPVVLPDTKTPAGPAIKPVLTPGKGIVDTTKKLSAKNNVLTIKNPGKAPLKILSVTIIGKDAKSFKLNKKRTKKTLKSGKTTTVSVKFIGKGKKTATLLVVTNEGTFRISVDSNK
jgi:hypothetical protein